MLTRLVGAAQSYTPGGGIIADGRRGFRHLMSLSFRESWAAAIDVNPPEWECPK
jgi:hypothetical protein